MYIVFQLNFNVVKTIKSKYRGIQKNLLVNQEKIMSKKGE